MRERFWSWNNKKIIERNFLMMVQRRQELFFFFTQSIRRTDELWEKNPTVLTASSIFVAFVTNHIILLLLLFVCWNLFTATNWLQKSLNIITEEREKSWCRRMGARIGRSVQRAEKRRRSSCWYLLFYCYLSSSQQQLIILHTYCSIRERKWWVEQ